MALLFLLSSGAHGAGCIKKTAGYFLELNAAATSIHLPAPAIGSARPLTASLGDPERGRTIVADPQRGGCLSCHRIAALGGGSGVSAYANQGDIGPGLDGVARRYDEGQLRQRVMDPKPFFPKTIMPAFYKKTGFSRPLAKYADQSILTAQEIEDVVAFLKSLR
jgi:sulfur-oxidizing protein SoxX